MGIVTVFFVFLAIAMVGVVGTIVNMITAMNSDLSRDDTTGIFIRHGLFGVCWFFGAFGSLISGVIWIVQQFS